MVELLIKIYKLGLRQMGNIMMIVMFCRWHPRIFLVNTKVAEVVNLTKVVKNCSHRFGSYVSGCGNVYFFLPEKFF